MTYSPDKPDAGPSPRIDVTQLQTDFSQYNTKFSLNHTALNDFNQGDHESVILMKQVADPGVTEDLTVLYDKDIASFVNTQPQLFVQIPKFLPNENDTTTAQNVPMQLTYNQVNVAGPQYQSFLIGGYLLYFGKTSLAMPVTITLSPAPTKILMAIATPNNFKTTALKPPFGVSTNILNNSQFQIFSDATGVYTFGWWAIAQA